MKPVLGITMGDAAGIGAEIIVKSLADKHLYEIAQPVVIGDKKMMQRALDLLQSPLKINVVTNLDNLNTKLWNYRFSRFGQCAGGFTLFSSRSSSG